MIDPTDVPEIADYGKLLDGRVAVITGGGSGGIGGAIATLFAQHGALVEIAEIDPRRAEESVAAIETAGGTARAHVLDVCDPDEVERLAGLVLDHHGRCDVLVNNVGDYRPLVRFEKSGPESWDAMIRVNLYHFYAVTHAFLGSMIEHQKGSIVNVHSVEGMRGYPGEPVYGSLKGAVAHFTTCLAVQQGRNGIRVNGIGPGIVETPLTAGGLAAPGVRDTLSAQIPLGRIGMPVDIGAAAVFLASPGAGYITGQMLYIDGGILANQMTWEVRT